MGHTFIQHLYHIIFSTKGRQRCLHQSVRPRILQYICGIAGNSRGAIIAIGAVEDHVHLLASIRPDVAVSKFVGVMKANSSKWISQTFPPLRDFAWQAGYSSFTVSQSNGETVAAYIKSQEERHRKLSFQDELRALLERHGIDFDRSNYLD